MAEVQESNNSSGIKLFGTTIWLHENDEGRRKGDDDDDEKKRLAIAEKIIPCPRCKSMETKFCYFNNYNVNQPRHFCKACQRYWTAGGALRNVPVGAGRRKNKPPTFSDGCMFDASAADHGGFEQLFLQAKRRRRCDSNNQSC